MMDFKSDRLLVKCRKMPYACLKLLAKLPDLEG